MTKMQRELSEMKLRRLKDALRASGHYAMYIDHQVIINSMQSITFRDLNYIVTDDQTGEFKTFGTESSVIDYLNKTGDTTTMPELQRGSESAVADDISCGVELLQMRQALEFYADAENYEADVVSQWQPVIPVSKDAGKIARQALGRGKTE